MKWNWQNKNWPEFTWDASRLTKFDQEFQQNAGTIFGSTQHLSEDDTQRIKIALMSSEAVSSSGIEGETLNRDSVQSSLQRVLGLRVSKRHVTLAENGFAEVLVDLYQNADKQFSSAELFAWHRKILDGRKDISIVGDYRASNAPMQIISGPSYAPKVHFEAPPSDQVSAEMNQFIKWLNSADTRALPPLIKAGISHIWFESIHPFEDGNGRLGRLIAEKILTQSNNHKIITSLSNELERNKKSYYEELHIASKQLDIQRWLKWFANQIIHAQHRTLLSIEFVIEKTKLLDQLRDKINVRQEKALIRMFEEGIDGFKGGLSAKNYMTISSAPPATTTRDLADLVEKGALVRRGERKATRYFLKVKGVQPPEKI